MQRNSLNKIFKTLSQQEQMILSSSMYEKIYLRGFLERSPLQRSSPREKEKKGENSHKACMGTFSSGRSLPIYRHLVSSFFIKTLIIMSIFTNIRRPYVCDPISLYISLVNNTIDQTMHYWSTLINYLHQHID